jgi:hypothetical protein
MLLSSPPAACCCCLLLLLLLLLLRTHQLVVTVVGQDLLGHGHGVLHLQQLMKDTSFRGYAITRISDQENLTNTLTKDI